jgi:hypothetical protein
MHRNGKAPWAFHDFFLRDMDHSCSDASRVAMMPGAATPWGDIDSCAGSMREGPPVPGCGLVTQNVHECASSSRENAPVPGCAAATSDVHAAAESRAYAFFPGCQIGAGAPDLVLRTYAAIKGLNSGVGMLLMCCGAPAEWAGDTEKHMELIVHIRSEWAAMGSPTLLMACPSCLREFREYLPDIETVSVYEWLSERLAGGGADLAGRDAGSAEHGEGGAGACIRTGETVASGRLPGGPTGDGRRTERSWAVFDPCSSRHEKGARTAVRELARRAGLVPEELPIQSDIARCCGYGGQPSGADPAFAARVAKDRADESEMPYITWCFNCRDAFVKEGKEAKHILELLFPPERAGLPSTECRGLSVGSCASSEDVRSAGSTDGSATSTEGSIQYMLPTVSERRRNREYLKGKIMSEYVGAVDGNAASNVREAHTGETLIQDTGGIGDEGMRHGSGQRLPDDARLGRQYDFALDIPDEVLRKMDGQRILVDDVYEVVDFMRRTGRRVFDPAAGTRSGYRKIGHMTYWVSYREADGAQIGAGAGGEAVAEIETVACSEAEAVLAVTDVYAHRMSIDIEQIWNGHKTREEFINE